MTGPHGRSSIGSGSLPGPARLWTVEQANERLRGLGELLPELRGWVVRLRKVHEQLDRLASFWGKEIDAPDHPDRSLKDRLQTEWEALTQKLEQSVSGLEGEGIEVKDLDSGLVDFYGLVEGEVQFLCWREDEDGIGFFHSLTGGFQSRRPLPNRTPRASAHPGRPP